MVNISGKAINLFNIDPLINSYLKWKFSLTTPKTGCFAAYFIFENQLSPENPNVFQHGSFSDVLVTFRPKIYDRILPSIFFAIQLPLLSIKNAMMSSTYKLKRALMRSPAIITRKVVLWICKIFMLAHSSPSKSK